MSQVELLPEGAPISPFLFQDKPIRTQLEGDTLWFAARDVCSALNIDWSGKTLSAIPKSWQGMGRFPTPSGFQQLRAIIEPAVYKLAFRSNKPEADTFPNWIASEVVPSIRKTGKYVVNAEPVEFPSSLLSPAHRSELKSLVDAKLSAFPASVQGKARSEIWSRFNRHFRIAEYAQLPVERMAEARDYLIELQPKALTALAPAASLVSAPALSLVPID